MEIQVNTKIDNKDNYIYINNIILCNMFIM